MKSFPGKQTSDIRSISNVERNMNQDAGSYVAKSLAGGILRAGAARESLESKMLK